MRQEDQVRELIDQVRQAVLSRTEFRTGLQVRHVKSLGGLLAIGLALSLGFFVISRPHAQEIPVAVETSAPSPIAEIVIDVAGKVAKPGVYRLPQGSRAIDAVEAAGGVLDGVATDNINLAHILADGEQILVGATLGSTSTLIDINNASVAELDRLPGVGPVLAARIVTWRQSHGRFRRIDDIKNVPGVGAATFADLKSLIRV